MHVAQHIIAMSLYYNIPPGLIKIDIYICWIGGGDKICINIYKKIIYTNIKGTKLEIV